MAKKITLNSLNLPFELPDNWLVGGDSGEFARIVDRQFQQITKNPAQKTPPKICIAESEPVQFLASFISARAAKCPIFLCNPNWVKQEWEQVFDLVQPDLIIGQNALENIKKMQLISHLAPFSISILGAGKMPPPQSNSLFVEQASCLFLRMVQDFTLSASPTDSHKNPHQLPITNYQLPSIMIPTGGSSGKIRFAIHTWETLTASVQGFQQYFQVDKINSFCVLPLYHVSGFMQFVRSFTTGGKLVIQPFKTLELGEKADIEPEEFFISLVPTQLQRLLQNPDTANWLSRFRTVLLGGAPAWPELLETARNYQIKLAPSYGMTETASQIATLKPEDFLAGNNSSGQVLPHAQITIRSPKGEILCYNQIGNIAVNAKSLALGYYPEYFGDREYFQLDDLGFFDRNNYLNIVGRSSDKIITGGENVFPAQVEAAIRTTNLVADVAVIGLPDKNWGQVVTAMYVPINSEVTVKNLQAAIEDKLSKFKRPKNWIVVEQLPRNSQGKVNREQLQEIGLKYQ
ncbi:2-succinylbenzoate--CoA ligase [Tychonema sp. LEGE 07203]|uniref:2-succinylbenzoate--CoA ligase n=1 Tax=Tychonema sp. LEGE 07203 TaxID=1828671 RepID=UPI001882A75E|nr:2-succinylbenzoate--CoA ligase [Tychonema sp. LEGE 07203]MBE9093959.1 2-succinylbenzoate--CoA ligase [Tychonema sp. LEGE 07203]